MLDGGLSSPNKSARAEEEGPGVRISSDVLDAVFCVGPGEGWAEPSPLLNGDSELGPLLGADPEEAGLAGDPVKGEGDRDATISSSSKICRSKIVPGTQ
ncbi:unnamed protein product [Linum trigynum]|uniref:Uncharacterized protein n=1 Tax=Linum trigynum TaxID=586398 RepID=A0AAV2E6X1_9ROSI